MSDPKYTWHKIAESEQELSFNENGMLVTKANSKKITVIKFQEKLYACGYACPHAGGILADGNTDALGNIVCPLHKYKFSLHNGRNISGEGYFLKTYPVQVNESGVFVGMEEKKFLGLF